MRFYLFCQVQAMVIAINLMSSKGTDEESVMYSKSDNIETIITDETDEVIKNFSNYFFLDTK